MSLNFDFSIVKTSKTITINKEFNVNISQLWDAFTKQELLDLWWAPKPWESKTKFMKFEVGGKRFYAIVIQERKNIGRFKNILLLRQKRI